MPLFADLWAHHPALQSPPVIEPCLTGGRSNYDNQCVIRLGVAMTGAGLSLSTFPGAFCWHGHGRKHPLRVEQFKLWLNSDRATFVPYAEKYKRDSRGRQTSYHAFLGRQGIAAFLDFWGANNTGDHIDLWDGSTVAHGDRGYFERSREIWFWPL
jgi:hypothetical protein